MFFKKKFGLLIKIYKFVSKLSRRQISYSSWYVNKQAAATWRC